MGRATPPIISDRPQLLPGLEFYLKAYTQLQHDRPTGFSVGSIPWTSILTWAQFHGLDPDQTNTLEHHIRHMEAALAEFIDKNNEQQRTPDG